MTFAKTIFTAIQKPFPTEILQYLNRKVIHYKNKWSTEMPAMYLLYFRRINNDRIHIFVAKYLFLLDVLGWMCKHVDAVFRDCFCLKIQKSWRYFVRWAWAWVRVWCTSISMSMNINMSPPPPQIMSGLKAPGPALTVVAVKRSVFYSPSPSVYLTDREMV